MASLEYMIRKDEKIVTPEISIAYPLMDIFREAVEYLKNIDKLGEDNKEILVNMLKNVRNDLVEYRNNILYLFVYGDKSRGILGALEHPDLYRKILNGKDMVPIVLLQELPLIIKNEDGYEILKYNVWQRSLVGIERI